MIEVADVTSCQMKRLVDPNLEYSTKTRFIPCLPALYHYRCDFSTPAIPTGRGSNWRILWQAVSTVRYGRVGGNAPGKKVPVGGSDTNSGWRICDWESGPNAGGCSSRYHDAKKSILREFGGKENYSFHQRYPHPFIGKTQNSTIRPFLYPTAR